MATILKLSLTLLIFLSSFNPRKSSNDSTIKLNVEFPSFKNSLKLAMSIVQKETSTISNLKNLVKDFQSSNILSDCAKLLESTQEVLDWSLTKFHDPLVKDFGTGNLKFDLQNWLSSAMTNLATCNEELATTTFNTIVKEKMAVNLEKVTKLVNNQLASIQKIPTMNHGFQSWFDSHDWKRIQAHEISANIMVALDGSGNLTSIMAAINSAPSKSSKRFVIHIKNGIYKEYVTIPREKWNIMLVGDGIGRTIISGDRSHAKGWTTSQSATIVVDGQRFIAVNITFENTAGPNEGQAVALLSNSDLSVFYHCGIKGYQDTLCPQSNRQFFRECQISGTVDFIFGFAKVVFQKCDIRPRQALPGQSNTITAQGRELASNITGFSFDRCNISGDTDLVSSTNPTPTYLGRPWKPYSTTLFMQSYMSDIIMPEGWLRWNESFESTLFYGEYKNYGPGASTKKRVKWKGVHVLDSSQAHQFTVSQFINGDSWLPSTGVPYNGGLVN